MKAEFIPSQFAESDGECSICDARQELERALIEESKLMIDVGMKLMHPGRIGFVLNEEVLKAYLNLRVSLSDAVADYRVCFAQNLALYFTAERHGRLRKVPEFMGALDEYRDRALTSMTDFDSAFAYFQGLVGGNADDALELAHGQTMIAARDFWRQIETWTEERYKSARSLFAKAES